MKILALAAFLIVLAAPIAGDAQTADPEAAVIDELVVSSRLAGPAWWTVSDGDSVVWVLGTPGVLPRGVTWDQSVLNHRMQGANRLILPATATANLTDTIGFYSLLRGLRSRTPLEPALPPALRERFVAARTAIGTRPERYEKLVPFGAALQLLGDYAQKGRPRFGEPEGAVVRAARRYRVRSQRSATYSFVVLGRAVERGMTPAIGLACLDDALDEVEAGSARTMSAARGWARGDVRTALTAERGFSKCLNLLPGVPERTRADMAADAAAISRALGTPGYSVAVVPLRRLVAQGGVLDRLRTQGFTVRSPASAE